MVRIFNCGGEVAGGRFVEETVATFLMVREKGLNLLQFKIMKKTRFVQRFFYLFSCLIVWSGMTVSAQEQERRFDLKMQDAELSQVIERLR